MKKMAMFRICLESFLIMNENQKGGEAILYSRGATHQFSIQKRYVYRVMKGSYVSMRRHVIRGEEGQTECL